MSFLYCEYIASIEDCPAESYMPRTIDECYRWVFEDINNSDNFLPPALRSRIFANNHNHIINRKCEEFAPSFHETLNGSLDHFFRIMNLLSFELKQKRYGTHIAKGKIDVEDGVCSDSCKKFTHFDIHFFEDTVIKEKFEILQEIKEDYVSIK